MYQIYCDRIATYSALGGIKLRLLPKLSIVICALALTACATIVTGSSWLTVETNPTNVKVTVTAIQLNKTETKISPFKMELSKKSNYTIVVNTPNYRSEEILIRRKLSNWFWGNILLGGGPIGMAIDYATTDMWRHNKHLIIMDLESLANAPDIITINIPVKITYDSGAYDTIIVPVTFHKTKGPKYPEKKTPDTLAQV